MSQSVVDCFCLFLRSFYVIPFNDGLWHHICVSWENGQGLWDVLIDGAVIARGSNWHRTLNLRPGKLVVGQRQTFLGGGFTLSDSFAGKVAFVNLWRTKIAKSKIKEMAKSCSPELGNVTDWRMFRHGTQGDAEIRSPQSCVSGSKWKAGFFCPLQEINYYTLSIPVLLPTFPVCYFFLFLVHSYYHFSKYSTGLMLSNHSSN